MKEILQTDNDVEEFINNYWLNLGDTRLIKTTNPFNITKQDDDPTRKIMSMMMKPENFYFTCKHLFNMTIAPMQSVILQEMWNRPFPMLIGSRGLSKTTLLAVYSMLKAILEQGSKVVVCGAGFRQSKLIFEYANKIWESSDMLRDIFTGLGQGPKVSPDRLVMNLGESTITCIPIGTGEKIRGLRASVLCVDEFASVNPEIFEIVLSGFTSVSSSPIESMKFTGRMRAMKALGIPLTNDDESLSSNQSIISGTCYYTFNHFYAYWKKWHSIIETKGDINKLEEIFQGEIPEKFNWKDYSIIRIPVELIPDGFMDSKSISKAKVSLHNSQYLLEYGACWSGDSNGFFKRALIEKCVARDVTPIELNGKHITFEARMKGDPNKEYVFGIDPASEADRFSIIILELHEDHRRIVHCWTTKRSEFKKKASEGGTKSSDFYQYCARKIRELMSLFPCRRIILDSQGGGYAISEALQNKDALEPDELPIYEIIDENKEKETDTADGLHILELAMFSKAEWVNMANNGMKKDFEDKVLLFPDYDAALLGIAQAEDLIKNKKYDSIEDCIMEIEELKDELATIIHTQTGVQGRDRWDTPETKEEGNKKGRMRKDRYSSLLMANMAARILSAKPYDNKMQQFYGGIAQSTEKPKLTGKMWVNAPEWFTNQGGNDPIGVCLVKQS